MRGALWMMASMAGFAIEDAFLKKAAGAVPLGEILLIEGLCGMAFFALLALRRGEAPLPRGVLTRTMAVRSGFEIVGRLFYALAIALTPLSSTSAILQATPLIVVPAAAVLFGERVGVFRWTLIGVGFLAVLLIIRPGGETFTPLSLLAVAGMLGFAGRDLATRAAPLALSNVQLGTAGFGVLALAGVVLSFWTGIKAIETPGLLAGAIVFGVSGYAALTIAMRSGEVSAVTPFRYSRLVFALILSVAVFGEHPDAMTLAGSAIIVACGVALLTRKT
nr:DMT family transporter [Stagnihabitans tardus]